MGSRLRTSRKKNRAPLGVENLEDRRLLSATTGDMWSSGSRITYSFAPDGTNIGGYASNLFSSMAALGFSQAQVELQFEKAAAVWQAAANINLALVPDGGQAYGTSGDQQDDPRFGDIRIGGEALTASVLACCFLPPSANGGTLAGDIVVNTTQPWQVGSSYDIETVAIHEIGHALGLDHSSVSSACLYTNYTATKEALTSDDMAGIQSIYGARKPDSFDASASNNTAATATNINSFMNSQGQITLTGLDITTNTDYDFYSVTAPSNTNGTLTVTMQSSNLSSLDPKLIVYNSAGQALGTATAPASYGGSVSVTINGVNPGDKFTIKCMAADAGPSGTGAYALQVNSGSATPSAVAAPNTVVAQQASHGASSANDSSGSSLPSLFGGLDKLVGTGLNVVVGDLVGVDDALTVTNPKKFNLHFGRRNAHNGIASPTSHKPKSHQETVVTIHSHQRGST